MINIDEIKVLHLEPTTDCNAKCPQCPRTIQADMLVPGELTLSDIKKIFPVSFVRQLDKMFMCGDFGEPAAATDTLKIYEWFKEINPSIVLGMNTNGGLRSSKWWQQLATIFGKTGYVVFSIDGLKDTNHIYRIDVNWTKLMTNVSAFIGHGGIANWDMLIYKHNEHQLDEAITLAKQLGFKCFRSKVTRREINVKFLELPSNITKQKYIEGNIKCHALQEKSIYVSATGIILPCCFIGENILRKNFQEVSNLKFKDLDLRTNNLLDILDKFNVISDTWNKIPYSTCTNICSTSNGSSNFTNQWKTEINLT